jgi:hypothetical protein
MKRPLKFLPFFVLTLYISLFAENLNPAVPPPPPDSLAMPIFTAASPSSDSLKLEPGDSIFIFSGELYYRARSSGKDFFISRDTLIEHADSLVIYQYYRLGSGAGTTNQMSDSAVTKVERQRCTAITQNGTRCMRLATPGSDRCWQHKR